MSTLDGSIVNIALPVIMKELEVTFSTVSWVMMIYLLTVSTLLLSFGRMSDIKGRRWVFCRGFFIFAMGSLLCGLARNALWLIAARAFQGIGAAMIMACSPALVVDIFPESE
ncbi:MFS transporter, partial [Thermodesulfobacteriota bacterium]